MQSSSKLKLSVQSYLVILTIGLFGSFSAGAHQGHTHHPKPPGGALMPTESDMKQRALRNISEDYNQVVKPIFDQKCLDCHGGKDVHPWYHKIPGVRQMMDRDVAEGTEHLDMSKGFPFGGHGTDAEDLDAIVNVVKDGSMPPFAYRFMHPGSKVQSAEREAIIGWVERSQKLLNSSTHSGK